MIMTPATFFLAIFYQVSARRAEQLLAANSFLSAIFFEQRPRPPQTFPRCSLRRVTCISIFRSSALFPVALFAIDHLLITGADHSALRQTFRHAAFVVTGSSWRAFARSADVSVRRARAPLHFNKSRLIFEERYLHQASSLSPVLPDGFKFRSLSLEGHTCHN